MRSRSGGNDALSAQAPHRPQPLKPSRILRHDHIQAARPVDPDHPVQLDVTGSRRRDRRFAAGAGRAADGLRDGGNDLARADDAHVVVRDERKRPAPLIGPVVQDLSVPVAETATADAVTATPPDARSRNVRLSSSRSASGMADSHEGSTPGAATTRPRYVQRAIVAARSSSRPIRLTPWRRSQLLARRTRPPVDGDLVLPPGDSGGPPSANCGPRIQRPIHRGRSPQRRSDPGEQSAPGPGRPLSHPCPPRSGPTNCGTSQEGGWQVAATGPS